MRDEVRFLLGDEVRTLRGVRPTLTVLEWLRTVERRCGTKEGCAEGDCGACTVLLGTPEGIGMRYRAVNACILFVPALDGRHLLTVEDLRGAEGGPHPVQQAMVDHHGSQCGFCTPGFVMSMAALHRTAPPVPRAAVREALAGNLCRCTGYRPILAAAEACAGKAGEAECAQDRAMAVRLRGWAGKPLELAGAGGRYAAPETVDDLIALVQARPGAAVLAGGTDIGLWVTKQHRDLPDIIALDRVAGLADIVVDEAAIRIGAAATYERVLPILAAHYPDLGPFIRRIGAEQVRNRGTIGGNLGTASPIGDMLPVLLALDATVVLQAGAAMQAVPVAVFFRAYRETALAPGAFIRRIDIPLPNAEQHFRAYKISKRIEQDISAVSAAMRLDLAGGRVRDIRLAFGGMAATPRRATGAEQAMRGEPWNDTTVLAAQAALDADFTPLSDMRASAAYRRMVARNLIRRFFLQTATPAQARLEPA